MNTNTIAQFEVLGTEILASVEGGSHSSYCAGQITGRIIFKQLLGQMLTPLDYVCQ